MLRAESDEARAAFATPVRLLTLMIAVPDNFHPLNAEFVCVGGAYNSERRDPVLLEEVNETEHFSDDQ